MYKLIKARSPFYVQYSSSEDLVTCDLYIWTGQISGKPAAAYNLSKEPISGSATFEIAELILDYINHTETAAGRVWVEVTTGDGVAASETNTYLATEGYLLYEDGIQHEGSIEEVGGFGIPAETTSASLITYRHYAPEGVATQIPKFNYTASNDPTDNTAGQLVNQSIGSSDTSIDYVANGITHRCFVDRFRCSKYGYAILRYIGKSGGLCNFYFTMMHKETLMSSSDSFQASLVNYASLSANNGLHAKRKRILGAKQMYTLNTDYISEYYNAQLEELFLSEFVWLNVDGRDVPVNIETDSLQKLKHVNDKLIQYTLNVTTAANYINIVR